MKNLTLFMSLLLALTTLACRNNKNTNLAYSGLESFSDDVAHVYPNNDPQKTLTVVCKDGRQLCYSEPEFYAKVQILCLEGKNPQKWYVEFYNNINLQGCPAWRSEYDNFPEWHTAGHPLDIQQVNSDNFSARITHTTFVNPDTLRFNFSYDDGIRVVISGCPGFEDWYFGGKRDRYIDCRIDTPRDVNMKIEYFELGGMADLAFNFNRIVIAEPLGIPGNFRVSQFDAAGNFLLDWDRVNGADYYEVEIYLGQFSSGLLYQGGILRADYDDIWVVKNNLQGYTSINYRVRARNNQGQVGAWSPLGSYSLPSTPPVIIVPPVTPPYSGRCDAHPQWGKTCGSAHGNVCIYSCYSDNGTYMQYGTPICRVQGSLTRC